MSKALSARFELGLRSRRKAGARRFQQGFTAKHRGHVFGVIRPVRRGMQHPARRELACDERGKAGLHQAALVMTLLRPWVRKEEMDRSEAFVRDHALQHLDGVVPDHSKI